MLLLLVLCSVKPLARCQLHIRSDAQPTRLLPSVPLWTAFPEVSSPGPPGLALKDLTECSKSVTGIHTEPHRNGRLFSTSNSTSQESFRGARLRHLTCETLPPFSESFSTTTSCPGGLRLPLTWNFLRKGGKGKKKLLFFFLTATAY